MYNIYLNDRPIPGATYDTRTEIHRALEQVKEWCASYDIGMARWDYDGLIMMFSLVIPDDQYQIVNEVEEEERQEHCFHNQPTSIFSPGPCHIREGGGYCTRCDDFEDTRE